MAQIVQANQSAVGLIHAVDMTIDCYEVSFNGKKNTPPKRVWTRRWSRDGVRERQRFQGFKGKVADDRGRPLNLGDLLEDGTTLKVLLNWDPARPQPLTPHDQGTVRASFQPQELTTSSFPNPAGQFAMIHVQTQLDDPRRSLSEFVGGSPRAVVEGKARVGEHETWKLVVEHPETKTKGRHAGVVCEIYVDPRVNFMIRKMVMHHPNPDPANPKSAPLDYVREVTKFQDFGNGVHLPMEVESRMYAPGLFEGPTSEVREIARDVTVNAKLPADALDFRFPENVLVVEDPPVEGRRRLHLWGPDDRSVKVIHSMADLGPAPAPPVERSSRRSWMIATYVAIAVVCLGLVVLWMRGRKRR